MNQPVRLNLELRIRKISALSLTFKLWESPSIQQKIERRGPEIYIVEGEDILPNQKKFCLIVNEVLNLIPSLNLPPDKSTDIETMVMLTQEKIFHWLVYIINKGTLSFKQGLKFSWTPYGIIDEYEIYKKFRRDLRFNQINDGRDPRDRKLLLYCLACAYADMKFVKHSLKEFADLIGDAVSSVIKDFNKDKVSVNTAMTMGMIWLRSDGYLQEFTLLYSGLKDSKYKAGTDKMFSYCIGAGYKNAAEYFYRKLNEHDRPKVLNQVGLECLVNALNIAVNYEQHRIPDLLLYIIAKMTDEQKKKFIQENIVKVYSIFLKTWPYQYLCVEIVNYFCSDKLQLSIRSSIFERIMNMFNYFLGAECAEAHNLTYQPLLENILKKIPVNVKMDYIRRHCYIDQMFMLYSHSIIKTIVDDPDLAKYRSELIDVKRSLGTYLLHGRKAEMISKYMEVLNFSSEERMELLDFCEDPDILEEMLLLGYFDTADEILKWQCELNGEELKKWKHDPRCINVDDFCLSLIQKSKCNLIDDYLKWQFDNDKEKIEKTRKKIFSFNYVCEGILIIWIKHFENGDTLDITRKNCSKLINYFAKPNELKSFKESVLQNQKIVHVLLMIE